MFTDIEEVANSTVNTCGDGTKPIFKMVYKGVQPTCHGSDTTFGAARESRLEPSSKNYGKDFPLKYYQGSCKTNSFGNV